MSFNCVQISWCKTDHLYVIYAKGDLYRVFNNPSASCSKMGTKKKLLYAANKHTHFVYCV